MDTREIWVFHVLFWAHSYCQAGGMILQSIRVGTPFVVQPGRAGMIEDVSNYLPFWARFKKGSGTFVRSTLRAVPAKVPDPFLNHAPFCVRVNP
jgi:hypothetical protein